MATRNVVVQPNLTAEGQTGAPARMPDDDAAASSATVPAADPAPSVGDPGADNGGGNGHGPGPGDASHGGEPGPGRRPDARPQPATSEGATRAGLTYLPGLDGLRALAVMLVVGYHLGYSGLAGGYIGVEVFFVLSGWLVCALLTGEHRATGRIRLRQFWVRRARRLLPAVVVVIAGTLAMATAVSPDGLVALRADAAGALGYLLNWRLIVDHQSYFEAADGPSALQHLWSLSIEEQFYLVFPLVCGLVLVRRRPRSAVALVLGAAVLSTAARLAWSDPRVDPSRIYFGTDTRAAGLLAGVALGLVWVPSRLRPRRGATHRALDAAALAGLAVVAWYALAQSEHDRSAFGLPFSAVQVATLVVIAVVAFPAPTLVGRALAVAPLRWIGQRSYGIYLIHWPVIVFTARAPGQQPEAVGETVVQIGLICGLAALSYRWIEQPVRRRGLVAVVGGAGRRVNQLVAGRPAAATAVASGALVLLGCVSAVSLDVVSATEPRAPSGESVTIGPTTSAPAAPGAAVPPATVAAPRTMTAVGDSVMVGGASALSGRIGTTLTLDAAVGRQMLEAPAIIRGLADQHHLGDVVIVHLGNNGPFTPAQIDDLFAAIGPDREVVLVTVLVPRRWEGEVNDALVAAAARHPNARLADWRSVATSEPGLTLEDGYHLTPAGAQRYADVITAVLPA